MRRMPPRLQSPPPSPSAPPLSPPPTEPEELEDEGNLVEPEQGEEEFPEPPTEAPLVLFFLERVGVGRSMCCTLCGLFQPATDDPLDYLRRQSSRTLSVPSIPYVKHVYMFTVQVL